MQTYPNYSMTNQVYPMMYQQPNPYIERMGNLQQFQHQLQMPVQQQPNQAIHSRFVDGFENITANDVPMNGGALFIKNDGSEIQVRQWNANGTISKTSYLPQIDALDDNTVKLSTDDFASQINAFNDVLRGIQEDVKGLSEKIDRFGKVPKAKKENLENE